MQADADKTPTAAKTAAAVTIDDDEGWQVQRPRKQHTPTPVTSKSTIKVQIDPELIGVCIGTKGTKKHQIQEATGATIGYSGASPSGSVLNEVVLTGSEDEVLNAYSIIVQLVIDFANAKAQKGKSWTNPLAVLRVLSAMSIPNTVDEMNKSIVSLIRSKNVIQSRQPPATTTTTTATNSTQVNAWGVTEKAIEIHPKIQSSSSHPFSSPAGKESEAGSSSEGNQTVRALRECTTIAEFAIKLGEYTHESDQPNTFCFAFAHLGWLVNEEQQKRANTAESQALVKKTAIFLASQATSNSRRLRDYQIAQLWYGCAQGELLSLLDDSSRHALETVLARTISCDLPDFEKFSLLNLCLLAWSAAVTKLRDSRPEQFIVFHYLASTVQKNGSLKFFPVKAISKLTLAFGLYGSSPEHVSPEQKKDKASFFDFVAKDVAIRGFVDYTMEGVCQVLYAFAISGVADQRILDGVEDEFFSRSKSSISMRNVATAAWCYAHMAKTKALKDDERTEFMESLLKLEVAEEPLSHDRLDSVTVLMWSMLEFKQHRMDAAALDGNELLEWVVRLYKSVSTNEKGLEGAAGNEGLRNHYLYTVAEQYIIVLLYFVKFNHTKLASFPVGISLESVRRLDFFLLYLWCVCEKMRICPAKATGDVDMDETIAGVFEHAVGLFGSIAIPEQKHQLVRLLFVLLQHKTLSRKSQEHKENENKEQVVHRLKSTLTWLTVTLLQDQTPGTMTVKPDNIDLLYISAKLGLHTSSHPSLQGIVQTVIEGTISLTTDDMQTWEELVDIAYSVSIVGVTAVQDAAIRKVLGRAGVLFAKLFGGTNEGNHSVGEVARHLREKAIQLLWCLSKLNKLDLRVISTAINMFIEQMEYLSVTEIITLFESLATFRMTDAILLQRLIDYHIRTVDKQPLLEQINTKELCTLSWAIGSTANVNDLGLMAFVDLLANRVQQLGLDKFSTQEFASICSCLSRPDVAGRPSVRQIFETVAKPPLSLTSETSASRVKADYPKMSVDDIVSISKSIEFQ